MHTLLGSGGGPISNSIALIHPARWLHTGRHEFAVRYSMARAAHGRLVAAGLLGEQELAFPGKQWSSMGDGAVLARGKALAAYYLGLLTGTRCFRESTRGGEFAAIMGFDYQYLQQPSPEPSPPLPEVEVGEAEEAELVDRVVGAEGVEEAAATTEEELFESAEEEEEAGYASAGDDGPTAAADTAGVVPLPLNLLQSRTPAAATAIELMYYGVCWAS